MQVGERIVFGNYEWRILDIQNNAALIITECIIEQRSYHNCSADVTWANCELRTYLNGEFYDKFSTEEKELIIPAVNINVDNQWYESEGGEETEDYIFLLSIEETVCKYFGDSSKNLENRSTKQRYWFQKKDVNNDKRKSTLEGCVWWWWLRSPGRDNRRAAYIHGDGNIGIQGNGTYKYNSNIIHCLTGDNSGGVRPALWLNCKIYTARLRESPHVVRS